MIQAAEDGLREDGSGGKLVRKRNMLPMLVQFKIGDNKLTMACRSDMGKVIIIGGDRGWSQAKSAPD
jgi:hypothetical protein